MAFEKYSTEHDKPVVVTPVKGDSEKESRVSFERENSSEDYA